MSIMKKAVTSLTLDLSMPDVQASITCSMGDKARKLEILVTDRGRPFEMPANYSAMLIGTKPDGTALANGCVVQNGRIIYDFESGDQIATCAGRFAVTVWIMSNEGVPVATPKIWVNVIDTGLQHILESNDQFGILQDLENHINAILATGKQVIVSNISVPAQDFAEEITSFIAPTEVDDGDVLLLLPGDPGTKDEVSRSEITADIGSDGEGKRFLALIKPADAVPENDLYFTVVRLKDDAEYWPKVVMIGFDAASSVSSEALEELREELNQAKEEVSEWLGDVDSALDELHEYAEALKGAGDSPLPIEVDNEEEMTALLATADPGSVYKYVGDTTDTYTKGELYIVEEVSE